MLELNGYWGIILVLLNRAFDWTVSFQRAISLTRAAVVRKLITIYLVFILESCTVLDGVEALSCLREEWLGFPVILYSEITKVNIDSLV